MPRQALPRWSKSNRCWYANIGPAGPDGRATEVYFREPCQGVEPPDGPGAERQAFRWLDAYQSRPRVSARRAAKPSFNDIAAAYLERAAVLATERPASRRELPNLTTRLAKVCARVGDCIAVELTADDHDRLIRSLKAERLSQHYIRGIHRTMMACLNWAAAPQVGREGRLIPENPLRGVRAPKRPRIRGRYIGKEQLGQFFVWAAGRTRYRPPNSRHFERIFLRYWTFILATGCRPGEAIALRWEQIDWKRRVVVIDEHKTSGKTGQDKAISLGPNALRILRRIQADPRRHADFVFPHRPAKGRGKATTEEEKYRGQPWSSSQAAARALRQFRRLAIAAGCELEDVGAGRLTAYSGRYRSVTDKLKAGLSQELVARFHGHSSEMTRDVYEQLREEDLAQILADLESRL